MNIGIVTPYFSDKETLNSGLANHFSTLAQGLSNQGHSVVVIHIRPQYAGEHNLYEKNMINRSITVITYKATLPKWINKLLKKKWAAVDFLVKIKCILIAVKNLGKLSKAYKLEVIETTSFFSLCSLYTLLHPKKTVVTRVSTTFLQIMDNYYPFKSRLYRWIGLFEIWTIRKSKHLITHAHDHARIIKQLYNLHSKTISIIPHGIIPPAGIYPSPKNNTLLKVLYVGRFEYRKGTDILLEAIPIAIKRYPNIIFELIGDDKDNLQENNFRKDHPAEINAKVIFKGLANTKETNQAYADCDIFVAPSRYESFGLIYIEAMSFGKPVIGCNVGGVSEIITDYKNGLYANVDSAISLADKIVLLCENNSLRQNMGANAKETFEKKFTEEILAIHSVAYYQEAILSQ